MCMASKPRVERSAPPPMMIPEATDENVNRKRTRERQRAAAAFGRESTILGGGPGSGSGPTAQQKTLLGA